MLSHPQPPIVTAPVYCGCQPGPTGVMTHPGRMVSHQSASSCSALLLGFVLYGCRGKALIGAIFDHTLRLSTRVVGSSDLNITSVSKHTSSICARALREFISSELPRHQHDFTSTSIPVNCVREDISQSLVTHTEPFTSITNSKSSCAMPRT